MALLPQRCILLRRTLITGYNSLKLYAVWSAVVWRYCYSPVFAPNLDWRYNHNYTMVDRRRSTLMCRYYNYHRTVLYSPHTWLAVGCQQALWLCTWPAFITGIIYASSQWGLGDMQLIHLPPHCTESSQMHYTLQVANGRSNWRAACAFSTAVSNLSLAGVVTSIILVATKVLLRQTRLFLWQKYACRDKTFCRDKNDICSNSHKW